MTFPNATHTDELLPDWLDPRAPIMTNIIVPYTPDANGNILIPWRNNTTNFGLDFPNTSTHALKVVSPDPSSDFTANYWQIKFNQAVYASAYDLAGKPPITVRVHDMVNDLYSNTVSVNFTYP